MPKKLTSHLIFGLCVSLGSCFGVNRECILQKDFFHTRHKFSFDENEMQVLRDDGYTFNVHEGWIYVGDGMIRSEGPWSPFSIENGELIRISPPIYVAIKSFN